MVTNDKVYRVFLADGNNPVDVMAWVYRISYEGELAFFPSAGDVLPIASFPAGGWDGVVLVENIVVP